MVQYISISITFPCGILLTVPVPCPWTKTKSRNRDARDCGGAGCGSVWARERNLLSLAWQGPLLCKVYLALCLSSLWFSALSFSNPLPNPALQLSPQFYIWMQVSKMTGRMIRNSMTKCLASTESIIKNTENVISSRSSKTTHCKKVCLRQRHTGCLIDFGWTRNQGDGVLNQRLGDADVLRKFSVSGERRTCMLTSLLIIWCSHCPPLLPSARTDKKRHQ